MNHHVNQNITIQLETIFLFQITNKFGPQHTDSHNVDTCRASQARGSVDGASDGLSV